MLTLLFQWYIIQLCLKDYLLRTGVGSGLLLLVTAPQDFLLLIFYPQMATGRLLLSVAGVLTGARWMLTDIGRAESLTVLQMFSLVRAAQVLFRMVSSTHRLRIPRAGLPMFLRYFLRMEPLRTLHMSRNPMLGRMC